MSYLSELTDIREKVTSKIVFDEMLCRAVANPTENCLTIPVSKPGLLLYKNIFPYKHELDYTLENKDTFITVDLTDFSPTQTHYKNYFLVFYVFTHQELLRIRQGNKNILRTDFIVQRLEEIFNGARDLGIGKLNFFSLKPLRVMTKVGGFVLAYEVVEFNDR